ncbi:hypothetical protein [Desulfonema magnum]|uniref:Uncharacterized protein n=1 Tax=Desulfonema magnum TaxID=45655 RepID=A0A975BT84_9BACT|nr:hypothetical protein [Desulfonema magnum]QTA91246.1 Uncharacterized protein dnm_073100 [Desulfonema magnum]
MNQSKYDRLADFLNDPPVRMKTRLVQLKKDGRELSERDDFLWFILLQSFSTMGNSRGRTGLIGTESNYRRIAYDYVKSEVSESERSEHFDRVLRDAKVRMPGKKAKWLVSNLNRIESYGGVTKANTIAFSIRGRTEKIRFMKAFDGIGEKYGRNIWMDIYDKDFYESVAVDERIKKFSKELDVSFTKYDDHEKFYLELAGKINLQGWELDRLMYHFSTEILEAINA